jgi:hypothetical protein
VFPLSTLFLSVFPFSTFFLSANSSAMALAASLMLSWLVLSTPSWNEVLEIDFKSTVDATSCDHG